MIDHLTEGQETSFEHELEFSVGDRIFTAALNVVASFGEEGVGAHEYWGSKGLDSGSFNLQDLRYQCLAVYDEEHNEIQPTPEISAALEGAFEASRDAIEDRAYTQLD